MRITYTYVYYRENCSDYVKGCFIDTTNSDHYVSSYDEGDLGFLFADVKNHELEYLRNKHNNAYSIPEMYFLVNGIDIDELGYLEVDDPLVPIMDDLYKKIKMHKLMAKEEFDRQKEYEQKMENERMLSEKIAQEKSEYKEYLRLKEKYKD